MLQALTEFLPITSLLLGRRLPDNFLKFHFVKLALYVPNPINTNVERVLEIYITALRNHML